jgi:hypothetical protein
VIILIKQANQLTLQKMLSEQGIKCRASGFKKTVNADDARRRRFETTQAIRKVKREQLVQKKRIAHDQPLLIGSDEINHFVSSLLACSPRSSEGDLVGVVTATRGIRQILSSEHENQASLITAIIDSGVLPSIVQNLVNDCHCGMAYKSCLKCSLLLESVWALTNISAMDCAQTVVNAGAIKPLIHLMEHHHSHLDPDIRAQAAWCLGNIAGEDQLLRDQVLREGALKILYVLQLLSPVNER